MLILAMDSNFHTFYPRQPQQGLIFCTPNAGKCKILCKGSVFLQLCDEIRSSMHQILTQICSAVSTGTSYMESATGFLPPSPRPPPPPSSQSSSNRVSPHFTIESVPPVTSPFFL